MKPWHYVGVGLLASIPLGYSALYLFRRRVYAVAIERGGPSLRAELARQTSGVTSLVNTPEYERLTNALVGIGANAALESLGIPRVE